MAGSPWKSCFQDDKGMRRDETRHNNNNNNNNGTTNTFILGDNHTRSGRAEMLETLWLVVLCAAFTLGHILDALPMSIYLLDPSSTNTAFVTSLCGCIAVTKPLPCCTYYYPIDTP